MNKNSHTDVKKPEADIKKAVKAKKTAHHADDELPSGSVGTIASAASAGAAAGAAGGALAGLPGLAVGAVIGGAVGAIAAEVAVEKGVISTGTSAPDTKKRK